MNTYFKIKQVKKIRFLSVFLNWILVFAFIGILLFCMFLLPSKRTPGEIKVLFFVKTFPIWFQYFVELSIFIFPATFIIKKFLNYSNKGIIYFDNNHIRVKTGAA